jgi:hypothetical protein
VEHKNIEFVADAYPKIEPMPVLRSVGGMGGML